MTALLRALGLGFAALALIAIVSAAAPGASAQQSNGAQGGEGGTQTSQGNQATIQDLRELVETIEDEDDRQELLENLRALIAARESAESAESEEAEGESLLDRLAERVGAMGTAIEEGLSGLPPVADIAGWTERQITDPERRERWIIGLILIIIALAAGFVAEVILRWLLRGPRARMDANQADGLIVRLPYLLLRTVLDIIPIAGFAAAAYTTLPLLGPSEAVTAVGLPLILANVIARAVMAAFRMILSPNAEGLRLLDVPTETARYVFSWVQRFVRTGVYGYFILVAAREVGLNAALFDILVKILGLVILIMMIVFIMQNRRDVADWLRREGKYRSDEAPAAWGPVTIFRRRVADLWHILALLYVVISYLVWAAEAGGGFSYLAAATLYTAIAVFVGWLAHASLQRVLTRVLRLDSQFIQENPEMAEKANRYLPALRTGISMIVTIVVLLFILQAWHLDVFGWLVTEPGRAFAGSILTIFFLIVGGLVLWEIGSTMIERYVERVEARQPEGARSSRLTTLLPLARNAMLVALSIFVALSILSELGVDIAPLLAGAGVIGLAIGFGAQTMVKDIITGVFNLIEDTVAVGDVVGVAGTIGVVEGVSVRSVKLRAYSGDHYTVPFGEITTVQNLTKEFSCYVFDVGVAYRENVDEVMQAMREIAEEFEKEPDWSPLLMGSLEIAGLQEMGDSAIVVRARYTITPGNQWAVGREFNRRIKAGFDERGIEIPFPHTTIYFGEDKDGSAPPAFIQLVDAPGGDGGGKDKKPSSRIRRTPPDRDAGQPAVMPDEGD